MSKPWDLNQTMSVGTVLSRLREFPDLLTVVTPSMVRWVRITRFDLSVLDLYPWGAYSWDDYRDKRRILFLDANRTIIHEVPFERKEKQKVAGRLFRRTATVKVAVQDVREALGPIHNDPNLSRQVAYVTDIYKSPGDTRSLSYRYIQMTIYKVPKEAENILEWIKVLQAAAQEQARAEIDEIDGNKKPTLILNVYRSRAGDMYRVDAQDGSGLWDEDVGVPRAIGKFIQAYGRRYGIVIQQKP